MKDTGLLLMGCAVLSLGAALTGCQGNNGHQGSAPNGMSRNPGPSAESAPVAPEASRVMPAPRTRGGRAASAAPGQFDFYLLNLSWEPEYCATHKGAAECAAHSGFVVHGLWPQNNDGTYPENCSNAPGPSNPQSDTDLQPTVSLVEHEWQVHGTCSGLSADDYFSTIREAFHEVQVPAGFGGSGQQVSASPQSVIAQFTGANPGFAASDFAVSCGNNYLTAMEVCFSKSLKPMACPAVKSCGASVIRIPPR